MEISSSMEGLQSLLGAEAVSAQQVKNSTKAAGGAAGSDQATVSSAGSEMAQMADDADVRTDKVAGIQAALDSGSYNVPSSAVASKVVDSMMGGES
jgi:negative regulator of flagellin synthesis FlgM